MSTEVPGNTNTSEQDTSGKSEVEILEEVETQETETETETTSEETNEEESEATEEATEETEQEVETEDKTDEDEEVEDEETIKAEEKITRPSWRTIKEKFPELAKNRDFRELYFRDQAMTEVFPTVAEAKEAASRAEAFAELDASIIAGDFERVFKALDERVLGNFADKVLPTLFSIDRKYFQRATQPIVIDILHAANDFAVKSRDENLRKSVRHLSNFLTGSPDIPQKKVAISETPEVKEEVQRLRNQQIGLFKTEEKKFLTSADSEVLRKVERLIDDGLDPKKELTDFSRQAVRERTLRDIREKLTTDENLTNKIKQLHKLAARNNFDDAYKSRIVAASLDRARKLIPLIRGKHKLAALGKQPPKASTKIKVEGTGTQEIKTNNSGGRVTSAKQLDTSKMSAEDFLHGKVVLRK